MPYLWRVMKSENISFETTQKDWDDFFAEEYDFEDAFSPVDSYAERVRVASQLSRGQIDATDQRLDEFAEEEIFPSSGFEFDR